MSALIPVCGRCGSQFVHHDLYEATPGYGMTIGCQNCNPSIRSDRERRVAALQELEAAAARASAASPRTQPSTEGENR